MDLTMNDMIVFMERVIYSFSCANLGHIIDKEEDYYGSMGK